MISAKKLEPLDDIFDETWLASRPELCYPLGENREYRKEVNKWLQFFNEKGWLDEKLIKRLRNSNTWTSYYSKINEFRAGYFLEKKLNFVLSSYEVSTIDNKNVEFKGKVSHFDVFIEVKTPLDLNRRSQKGGWFNGSDKVCESLHKAVEQLPENAPVIVILSDDLEVSLMYDRLAQHSVWECLNLPNYKKMSAVCILGNIYRDDMYKMLWAINENAQHKIDEDIFEGFEKICRLA